MASYVTDLIAIVLVPTLARSLRRTPPVVWFAVWLYLQGETRQKVGMPRKPQVEYPDAVCNVISRRDRREDIYVEEMDREVSPKTLTEAWQKPGWQVYA